MEVRANVARANPSAIDRDSSAGRPVRVAKKPLPTIGSKTVNTNKNAIAGPSAVGRSRGQTRNNKARRRTPTLKAVTAA